MIYRYFYEIMPKAQSDFDNIVEYIRDELYNPYAAENFAKEFFNKIDKVQDFPALGQAVIGKSFIDSNLRKFNVGNYIVFYIPEKKTQTINIMRIVYGAMDIDEELKTT